MVQGASAELALIPPNAFEGLIVSFLAFCLSLIDYE